MIRMASFRTAMRHLPEEIEFAQVNAEKIRRDQVFIVDGAPQQSQTQQSTRYYVRAGSDSLGYASSENPLDALTLIRQAALNGAASAGQTKVPHIGKVLSQHRPPLSRPEDLPYWKGREESFEAMGQAGVETFQMLSSTTIHTLTVTTTTRELRTIDSLGLDTGYRTHFVELFADVSVAGEDGTMVRSQAGLSGASLKQIHPSELVRKLIETADRTAVEWAIPMVLPGGHYPAIISGPVMRRLLMFAWQEFSAEAIQKGASCFPGTGGKVAGPLVTLINAPQYVADNLFSTGKEFPLDCEGTAVSAFAVVENGVFSTPFYTLTSAAADGVLSNGCAGRDPVVSDSRSIALTTVPNIFYLQPDPSCKASALTQHMGHGLILTQSSDFAHHMDLSTGNISVPVSGFYVENGMILGSVKNLVLKTTFSGLLRSICEIGGDIDFDDFPCKNYCVGSPSVRVSDLLFSV